MKKNQNQYLTDKLYHCCKCSSDQNTVPQKCKDHGKHATCIIHFTNTVTHIVKYFGKYACTGKTNHAVVWMRIFLVKFL